VIKRALLLGFLLSYEAFAGVCNEVNEELLQKHAPIPPYKVVSKREVKGLCELILNINGDLVPVYATKDFILAGEMFSNRGSAPNCMVIFAVEINELFLEKY